MKKRAKFIILAMVIILLPCVICSFIFASNSKSNIIVMDNNIEIKDTTINNQINNCITNSSSSMAQIEDKLYFIHINNNSEVELYEFKTGETRLIYTESFYTYTNESICLNNIYKGKILKKADSDTFLNTETGKFVRKLKKYSPAYGDFISFINDDKRYFWNFNDLYRYDEDKGYSHIATNKDLRVEYLPLDIGMFYITEPYLYYQKNSDGKIFICQYNTEKKEITDEIQVLEVEESYETITNVIVDKDFVYFIYENTLYGVSLMDRCIEKIYETDGYLFANYYKNKLFVGVSSSKENNGVFLIDMEDNKRLHQLYNDINRDSVSEIYIFDDDNVYFDIFTEEDKHVLYRYNLINNNLEMIFEEK